MAQQSCIRLISTQQECTFREGTISSTQWCHPELTLASDGSTTFFTLKLQCVVMSRSYGCKTCSCSADGYSQTSARF